MKNRKIPGKIFLRNICREINFRKKQRKKKQDTGMNKKGGKKKGTPLRITGLYMLRRPMGGSSYGFARSFRYAPFPHKTSATFWQGCKPTVCLSALPKRHIQPGRYAT
jgi:hypothetical protein